MKYFYDTELIEDGKTIDLISIGVVSEDGREFYAQSLEFNAANANAWVRENVFPYLSHVEHPSQIQWKFNCGSPKCPWMSRNQIQRELLSFIGEDTPEFWGYYSAYDHVALCQLFGKMIDLPKGWPMYTRDLKQWCDALGNPKLPEQGKGEHHALADARWNLRAYRFLDQYSRQMGLIFFPIDSK